MRYFVLIFAMSPCFLYAASFDCESAVSIIEKSICKNVELSDLDYELGNYYKELINSEKLSSYANEIKQSQVSWLKERNSKCVISMDADQKCLSNMYKTRIRDLNGKYFYISKFPFFSVGCHLNLGKYSDENICASKHYAQASEYYKKVLSSVLAQNFGKNDLLIKNKIQQNDVLWQSYVAGKCKILANWGETDFHEFEYSCLTGEYIPRIMELIAIPCNEKSCDAKYFEKILN